MVIVSLARPLTKKPVSYKPLSFVNLIHCNLYLMDPQVFLQLFFTEIDTSYSIYLIIGGCAFSGFITFCCYNNVVDVLTVDGRGVAGDRCTTEDWNAADRGSAGD